MRVVQMMDGAYIEKMLAHHFRGSDGRVRQIDFTAFSNELIAEHDELLRAYYYHCPPFVADDDEVSHRVRANKERFFAYLKSQVGITVRMGRLERRPAGEGRYTYIQRGVGEWITTDLLTLTFGGRLDAVVLVGGDSSLIPALERVQAMGVEVRLACHPEATPGGIWDLADRIIDLDEAFLNRCARDNLNGGYND